ncbi:MAG: sulfite exporter TauE/SafE family protein [Clostridiales bacterium]|nr:sulfite exporter TauE/SafE family protein [Clostridiales bacterium]
MFELNFLWIGLIEIFSHFVQGCTGFGATVIAAPVVTGLLGTAEGVPYGTLITMPMLYVLGIKAFKQVSWKDLAKIVILMAPGVLVGHYLFLNISPNTAKVCIGFIVTCIALRGVYQKFVLEPRKAKQADAVEAEKPETMARKVFRYGCLLLGGAIHGAFNIGGPLVTVYTIYSVKDKSSFRATMTWVWIIINTCFNMVNQYRTGQWTEHMWWALAVGVPLAAIGFYLGGVFHKKINHDTFLKLVYVVLTIVGGDMFVRALLTFIA